jgi:hypothetical protein
MKFHRQEHIVIRNESGEIIQGGSCYPTVLACLLDLELHQVPYFHLLYWSEKDRKENISKYLQNRYLDGQSIEDFKGKEHHKENFQRMVSISLNLWDNVRLFWLASIGYEEDYISDIDQWLIDNPDTPYLASGKSSRGVDHIVIYQNGKLLHDPHPSGEGLKEVWPKDYAFQILKKISE